MTHKVYISLATMPSRVASLEQTIESIYSQSDQIFVYLNQFEKIPNFLNDQKITTFLNASSDLGDTAKFYPLLNKEGYFLTLDDDIIYPKDYVETMCGKINEYAKTAFICVHGNLLPKHPLDSYYQEKRGVHFMNALKTDLRVDVPGTGTLAFHSSLYRPHLIDFPIKNMSDIWIFVIAYKKLTPVISIQRPEKWLRPTDYNHTDSIYYRTHLNDGIQTSIINQCRGKMNE